MKALIIKWRDASSEEGPFERHETTELMIMVSVGIYVRENKDQITISQDFWYDCTFKYRDILVIPKNNIIETKEINIPRRFLEKKGA